MGKSYLIDLTTDEQKHRRLPGFCSGELIAAIAMSEPGAGSDLRAIRTTARRDGDDYFIDGAKTFISNGQLADLIIVAGKTDPDAGHKGISLFMFEAERDGFSRCARRAYELTLAYAKDRQAFGQPIGSFQVNRHALAEIRTKLEVMCAYLDQCVLAVDAGELTAEEAAGAKWWATETQWDITDRCLQPHGGYGYINEYEIARLWRDARVQRLYGGTNEIMKDLIGRSMGL